MGDVKVMVELTIRVNDQIDDHELEPDYKEDFKFENGCDCTIPELLTWIVHQKKVFDHYVNVIFKEKYGD